MTRIIVHSVFTSVPRISPPAWLTIYYNFLRWWIHREAAFSTLVAVLKKKSPAIAASHTPNHPAFRTPRRRRNFYFFVEIKIFRFYCKIFFAVFANLSFALHNLIIYLLSVKTKFSISGRSFLIAKSNLSTCQVDKFFEFFRQG